MTETDWIQAAWTAVSPMAQGRELTGRGCGALTDPESGSATEIVVIGSGDGYSTEIYDVGTDSWRYGPSVPYDIGVNLVTTVQDGWGSFYVIGGYSYYENAPVDDMYQFDKASYEFVELEARLPYRADGLLGRMVSEDLLGLGTNLC